MAERPVDIGFLAFRGCLNLASEVMANSAKRQRRLLDAYAFPGFRPHTTVRGVFGDPKARVIVLVRRSKKRSAAAAVACTRAGTIGAYGGFAIFPVATRASTWRSRFGACRAGVAITCSASSWSSWR